jgi:hypothetical protein
VAYLGTLAHTAPLVNATMCILKLSILQCNGKRENADDSRRLSAVHDTVLYAPANESLRVAAIVDVLYTHANEAFRCWNV